METSVNHKCKAFTSLEQSRKLAEILPHESADMCYIQDLLAGGKYGDYKPYIGDLIPAYGQGKIRCWSLAALLEQLPYEICDDEGNSAFLSIDMENYQLVYNPSFYGDFDNIETDVYEDFVDACCEMLLKLKENNLL